MNSNQIENDNISVQNDVACGKALILMGVKHSGKTTFGKNLANILDIPFFDVDERIEKDVGMGVREYFKTFGKDGFQKAEVQACKSIFEENSGSFIVATGGGICDNAEALKFLRGVKIFLNVDEDVCFARILENAKKTGSMPAFISNQNPKNQDEERKIFHEFYENRKASYLKITDKIVEFEYN